MLGNEWVLALVCVVVYFGAGRQEARMGGHDHAALWAALSIAVSALALANQSQQSVLQLLR